MPLLVVGAVVVFIVGFGLGRLGDLRSDPDPVAGGSLEPPGSVAVSPADSDPDSASTDADVESGPRASGASPSTSRARIEGPLIALVIDDLGRDTEVLDDLEELGVDLTYSVLPFEQRTGDVVKRLNDRASEVLLHLPMQARGDSDPGPGALFLSMSREELRARTRRALRAVPGAVGVNNHMGSAFSANAGAMKTVLQVVADSQLFFLDSRTSSASRGFDVARELSMPAVERSVFLDDSLEAIDIKEQFRVLLERARRDGAAVAIGHPHAVTLEVLREEVPAALEAGYRFVRVSTLVEGSSIEAMG